MILNSMDIKKVIREEWNIASKNSDARAIRDAVKNINFKNMTDCDVWLSPCNALYVHTKQ